MSAKHYEENEHSQSSSIASMARLYSTGQAKGSKNVTKNASRLSNQKPSDMGSSIHEQSLKSRFENLSNLRTPPFRVVKGRLYCGPKF